MPLPRHRPNPRLLQSDKTTGEEDRNVGDFHYVYSTGDHATEARPAGGPEYHSSCNVCLTELKSDSAEGLKALRDKHGKDRCKHPFQP